VIGLGLVLAVSATGCVQLPLAPPGVQFEPPRLPRYVSREAASAAAYMRGRMAQREGRWIEALEELRQAAGLTPDDLGTLRALVEVAMRLNRPELALEGAQRAHELAPDDESIRRDYVAVLVAVGEYERAAALLEARLEAPGEVLNPDAALGLLSIYLELEQEDKAEALARRLRQQDPDSIEGYLALGTVLEQQQRFEEAEKLYTGAFDRGDLDPRLYDGLARIARSRGDTPREIEFLRGKLELLPGDPGTLGRLLEIHSGEGDRGALISVIEEIVYYNQGNARARLQLGVLYLQAGRLDDAIESLSEVARTANVESDLGAQSRYLLGRIYARTGQSELSAPLLESIPERASTYVEAQLALVSLFQDDQRYDDALAALDRALSRSNSVPLQLQRAQLLQQSGRADEGVRLVEGLIEQHPDQAGDLYYQLGMLHTHAGDEERALQVMLRALEVAPDNPNVMNFVGYVWADRGVRLEEAEGLIRQAVELRPEDGLIVDSLGWVLYKRGLEQQRSGRLDAASESFGGAVEQLERARDLMTSGDPTIERHLGDVYQSLLRYEDALAAYEKALLLEPTVDEEQQIQAEIERVRRFIGQRSESPGAVD